MWRQIMRTENRDMAERAGPGGNRLDPETFGDLKIGVALGGGAARGWAHIGVMRALEEIGIRPHVVAGTSIGAVVGGCTLAGELDELERFARSISRRRMFGLMDVNFGGSSLIAGNRLAERLTDHLGDRTIESLDRKFAAITTEMGTGHEIWLSHGQLAPAICASYALPGVFKPAQIGGRWLLDGTLVNPVPVSVCRALGARMVIAVNLSTNMFTQGTVVPDSMAFADADPDDFMGNVHKDGESRAKRLLWRQFVGRRGGTPGISAVMIDAFNIIQDRIARSRLAGDPPDVMLNPKLGDIGLFDFYRADEAIRGGRQAVLQSVESLTEAVNRLK